MARRSTKYYHDKFSTLRNVIDAILVELEEDLKKEDAPSPRARRNLKEERIREFELNYAMGKWSKPKSLKKKSKAA